MLYDLTIAQPVKMLRNLSALITKAEHYAETRKFSTEVYVTARLAPDQFPFVRQVQIACDTVKLGAARLIGKENDAPKHDDSEKTFADLRARIESTINYLNKITPKDLEGAEDRKITQPRWEGKHMLGRDFLLQHLTPNLYFHVTTAYAILRHNGADVGKNDFLGERPFKS